MRLNSTALAGPIPDARRFDYDRVAQKTGIVHFGIGAFHRAHQAWYTDLAMSAGDSDWMITGVSLRSAQVAAQMNPQDGLFTVTQNGTDGQSTRIVGSVCQVLVASTAGDSVIAALAAPATRIASLTITEKGYCRAPDGGLDPALAGRDCIYRYLAEGLMQRRARGLGGLTLLACDNLADNGRQLQRLLGDYCAIHAPGLGQWLAHECAFPCTMVDRIVPATTAHDLERVADRLGLRDEAAVLTEPFSQWVIEDHFVGDRPHWDRVGAELVSDVAPYEMAKLRMLNGAHSALAYLGLARGHVFVHQAVADPAIRPMVGQLMRHEALPTIAAAPGQDLFAYADALLARFANAALNHRLAQIAMDGSQKIPQRWLATLADRQAKGERCPAIIAAMAGWLRHVRGDNGVVEDPLAARLRQTWDQAGADGIVEALFGAQGLMASDWHPDADDTASLLLGCR